MFSSFFQSPIPYPRTLALHGAPVRYRLGEISMIVPLFTFYRYKIFMQTCSLIPFFPSWEGSNSLLNILDDDGEQSSVNEISQCMEFWKKGGFITGIDIDNLVSLLIAVSDPVDPVDALLIIRNWKRTHRVKLSIPRNAWKTPQDTRRALFGYALHILDLESCAEILSKLGEVNRQLKKKLSQHCQHQDEPLSQRKKFWSNLLSKNSA